jgi:hypothetical protein
MNNNFKKLRADFPILAQKVNGYSLIACDNVVIMLPQRISHNQLLMLW